MAEDSTNDGLIDCARATPSELQAMPLAFSDLSFDFLAHGPSPGRRVLDGAAHPLKEP
jgi:hypothetical protein